MAVTMVKWGGWDNCVRLSNGKVEAIVTTAVGPRVMRLGFVGGRNLFWENAEDMGQTGDARFRIYGGHRFWHAPEGDPRSYLPDNAPVQVKMKGDVVKLTPAVEKETGMVKEMEISLDAKSGRFRVLHRLMNKGMWPVDAAPWALSMMAPGGFAIFPQEEFRAHSDYLLPARPLVLWHYTNMADKRSTWGKRFIILRQDVKCKGPTKFGFLNKKGWAAYALKGDLFVKTVAYDPKAEYVDFGCNCESFTDHRMIEVETVGPVTRLEPGAKVEHVECWTLHKAAVADSEASIEKKVAPLVRR